MSLQVQKMEHNMAKLIIEVPAEELVKAIEGAYEKNKKNIALPGFRKGKAPRKMIERMYGKGVFLEDAANDLIPDAYAKAAEESELEIVSYPAIDVEQIEEGKPFVFTAEVAVKPEIVLGEYKGIEVSKETIEVTDEEVDAELHKEQEKNSRLIPIEDRAAEKGDIVTLDYEGIIDGVSFPGGTEKDFPLMLGSGAFIPGFEDQLVGVKLEEPTEVHVTFPEGYHSKELIGKEAMDVSEFDTLEEYKEDIRKNLTQQKEATARRKKGDDVVRKIVENSQMDIPEPMVEAQQGQLKDDFAARIQAQGMSIEQYLVFGKMTMEDLDGVMHDRALENIQSRLVLEKIVETENIQPSQEEIDEEIRKSAEMYKLEVDKLKEMIDEQGMEQVVNDLAIQKAVEFVIEAAKEV